MSYTDLLRYIYKNLKEINENHINSFKPSYGEHTEYASFYKIKNFCELTADLISEMLCLEDEDTEEVSNDK